MKYEEDLGRIKSTAELAIRDISIQLSKDRDVIIHKEESSKFRLLFECLGIKFQLRLELSTGFDVSKTGNLTLYYLHQDLDGLNDTEWKPLEIIEGSNGRFQVTTENQIQTNGQWNAPLLAPPNIFSKWFVQIFPEAVSKADLPIKLW